MFLTAQDLWPLAPLATKSTPMENDNKAMSWITLCIEDEQIALMNASSYSSIKLKWRKSYCEKLAVVRIESKAKVPEKELVKTLVLDELKRKEIDGNVLMILQKKKILKLTEIVISGAQAIESPTSQHQTYRLAAIRDILQSFKSMLFNNIWWFVFLRFCISKV
jgi:hypothetical protein